MKVWTLTVAEIDPSEPCEIKTYTFSNEKEATDALNKAHDEWKDYNKALLESYGNDFELWLADALHQDITTEDYKHMHYIYDDGQEFLFMLEGKEI